VLKLAGLKSTAADVSPLIILAGNKFEPTHVGCYGNQNAAGATVSFLAFILGGTIRKEKRWRATAVQDAGALAAGYRIARSVLKCARPRALSNAAICGRVAFSLWPNRVEPEA